MHKYLDTEPLTFLLVDRYIIFNKFVKHFQLQMIMIYTGALLAKGHSPDINNGPGVTRIVPTFWPQHLFKLNSNNGPSPGHSNVGLHLFRSPTYGFLVGATSAQGLQA